MSHDCEECGESFSTLSRLRLHECQSDSIDDETQVSEESPAEDLPVEEDYPGLVGDLPTLVDDAQEGNVPALYRAIAEYASSPTHRATIPPARQDRITIFVGRTTNRSLTDSM